MGSFTAIWSKYSAWSRSLPSARRTTLPGSGGTNTSGSARVVITWAVSATWAGRRPSSMRNTSESNRAPSWRARTWVTTPDSDRFVPSGSARSVTTTSSSWTVQPGPSANQ